VAKKNEEFKKIKEMTDELSNDEDHDRQRLSDFLDKLIEIGPGAAEFVAKIAEAMNRQNATRLNTIKEIKKDLISDDEDSENIDAFDQIGRPFEEDLSGN